MLSQNSSKGRGTLYTTSLNDKCIWPCPQVISYYRKVEMQPVIPYTAPSKGQAAEEHPSAGSAAAALLLLVQSQICAPPAPHRHPFHTSVGQRADVCIGLLGWCRVTFVSHEKGKGD